MELMIIPMELRHVEAVAALEKECFSDPWSAASVASELVNPLSLWLIAEQDGEVAGYIGSQTVFDEADMMNLAVAPSRRRQGTGRILVETLCRILSGRGVKTLTLEVRESNEPAAALYRSLGFSVAGVRPNYYFKPRENALIMKKKLETI